VINIVELVFHHCWEPVNVRAFITTEKIPLDILRPKIGHTTEAGNGPELFDKRMFGEM